MKALCIVLKQYLSSKTKKGKPREAIVATTRRNPATLAFFFEELTRLGIKQENITEAFHVPKLFAYTRTTLILSKLTIETSWKPLVVDGLLPFLQCAIRSACTLFLEEPKGWRSNLDIFVVYTSIMFLWSGFQVDWPSHSWVCEISCWLARNKYLLCAAGINYVQHVSSANCMEIEGRVKKLAPFLTPTLTKSVHKRQRSGAVHRSLVSTEEHTGRLFTVVWFGT